MHNNPIAHEFDAKAEHYESNRLSNWYKAHAQELLEHCPKKITGDVLDIGCASGYQLRLLAKLYPKANLVGIDLSNEMIKQANQLSNSNGKFHFINDDFECLSEETRTNLNNYNFDLIICANTFHYFSQPQKAIKNMFERLNSGGTILILEREKSNSLLTKIWGWLHENIIKDQVEFYQTEYIQSLMIDTGFKNVKIAKNIIKYFWRGKLFTSIAVIKGSK